MSALSYSEEIVVPMCTTLPLEPLGSMRTSLAPSIGSKDPTNCLGLGDSFGDLLPDGRKLLRGDDCRDMFAALDLALVGALEGGADGDDPAWSWHLQLQIGAVVDGHELHVAWSPRMVW